jgi:type IV fimbrial biogenesis protein FimT
MTKPTIFSALGAPRRGGLTLIELMVTLAIVAVLLAMAVPSLRELVARKRVEGVANELASDVRYLQSEVIQRHSKKLQINFGVAALPTTCYAVVTVGTFDDGTTCNCALAAAPICSDSSTALQELKTVMLPSSAGVTLTASTALMVLNLNGLPKYPSPSSPTAPILAVLVESTRGGKVCVTANGAARPSLCSISGHDGTMPACTGLPAPCQRS